MEGRTRPSTPGASPQATKLGLRRGHRVALDGAPVGWALIEPPELLAVEPGGPADVIIAFFAAAAQLGDRLPHLAPRVHPDGAIWAAWPRRAGGHQSDLTDDVVRDSALALGLVDVKVAAMDPDWSALRLVWRKANRAVSPAGRPAPRPARTR